jgi:hypothetical protein
MTKIKTNDNRKNITPTFEDVEEGSMFIDPNSKMIFIKTAILKVEDDTTANAIDLEGDTHWFYDDEEIQPIQEIEITIKK